MDKTKQSFRVQRGSAGFKGASLPHCNRKGTGSVCHAAFLSPPKDEVIRVSDSSIAAREQSLSMPRLGMTFTEFYKKLGLL